MINKIRSLNNNKLLKNSVVTLIIRLSGVLFQFLILLLITNSFSEKIVGQFNYINTVLLLMSSLCLLGMSESFIQFSGKLEADGQENKIGSLYIKKVSLLVFSYLSFLLIFLFFTKLYPISFFSVDNTILFNKIFSTLFFSSLSLLNFQVIRAIRELFLSELFRNVARYGIILLFIVIIIIFNFDKNYILDVFLFSFLIIALSTTVVIFKKVFTIKTALKSLKISSVSSISYKKIIITSVPMSLSFLSLLMMQSFDTIMIEYYLEIDWVAFYTVAVKITFLVGVMQLTINSVIAPDISKFWFEKKRDDLKSLINKAIRLNFIFTLPIILTLILFSDQILEVFGSNYYNSKGALKILLFGQVVNAFCGPVGLYLNMTEKQNIFLKILLIATLFNVLLNIKLIPLFGINGAAISTSISLFLWNIFGVIYVYYKDKLTLAVNISMFK